MRKQVKEQISSKRVSSSAKTSGQRPQVRTQRPAGPSSSAPASQVAEDSEMQTSQSASQSQKPSQVSGTQKKTLSSSKAGTSGASFPASKLASGKKGEKPGFFPKKGLGITKYQTPSSRRPLRGGNHSSARPPPKEIQDRLKKMEKDQVKTFNFYGPLSGEDEMDS